MDINVSFSKIQTLYQCELSYKFTYIDGIRGGDNIYTAVGTLLHSCIEDYIGLMSNKNEVLTKFHSNYSEITQKYHYNKKKDKNEVMVEKNKFLFNDYLEHLTLVPKGLNVEIEKLVFLNLSEIHPHEALKDYNFKGFVDFIGTSEDETIIVDFKTSTKYVGEKKVTHGYQLILYGIALEKLGYSNIRLFWDFLKYKNISNKKSIVFRDEYLEDRGKRALVEIPFTKESKTKALQWVLSGIGRMIYLKDNPDKYTSIYSSTNFFCNNLCPHLMRCKGGM